VRECSDPRDCEEAIERLYLYLDGELTDERRELIARHLDECEGCVEAFGFEMELRRVISQKCRDRVPEELVQRIADALRREQPESA
jgi:mycothiol system anti-sigma-R factor